MAMQSEREATPSGLKWPLDDFDELTRIRHIVQAAYMASVSIQGAEERMAMAGLLDLIGKDMDALADSARHREVTHA